MVENGIKNEGANAILKNSRNLEKLNLSKNNINHHLSEQIQRFLENSRMIRVLNFDFNDIGVVGMENLAQGIAKNQTL
jgi:hypothetical protein